MNVGAEKWEEERERRDKNCKQKQQQQQAGAEEGGGWWRGRQIFNFVGQVDAAGGDLNFHFHLQLYNHILIFAQIGLTNLSRGREAAKGGGRVGAGAAGRAKLQQIKTTPAKRATKLVWHEKQRRLAGRQAGRRQTDRQTERTENRETERRTANRQTDIQADRAKWQTDRSAGCAAGNTIVRTPCLILSSYAVRWVRVRLMN